MRKLVMVNGGALGFGTGAPVSGGVFTITAVPSLKMKADGKGVFAGPLAWTFAGGNGAGCTPGSVVGAGSISPSSASVKTQAKLVVLEGDQVSVTFSGVSPGGNPVSFPAVPVKVASAGQNTVKAD